MDLTEFEHVQKGHKEYTVNIAYGDNWGAIVELGHGCGLEIF